MNELKIIQENVKIIKIDSRVQTPIIKQINNKITKVSPAIIRQYIESNPISSFNLIRDEDDILYRIEFEDGRWINLNRTDNILVQVEDQLYYKNLIRDEDGRLIRIEIIKK